MIDLISVLFGFFNCVQYNNDRLKISTCRYLQVPAVPREKEVEDDHIFLTLSTSLTLNAELDKGFRSIRDGSSCVVEISDSGSRG